VARRTSRQRIVAAVPTVLLTGASSGIGRACAERLAGTGWRVLAGARADADLEALAALRNVEPLRLDVTDEADVAAAAAAAGDSLDALVNNAGIAISGPVEVLPVDAWRRQLEVNLLGQVAVTRALLPALLAARGRIVNMSSISGRAAAPLLGPYAASKFALEAMNDALRRELRGHGVRVVAIEPGAIATPIWGKGTAEADAQIGEMDDAQTRRYASLIAALRTTAERNATAGLHPAAVAAAVETALTAARPRTRYLVGREARVTAALARLLPDRAVDALIARALR
jgi:NAD(P)-dependent dehydrogenase (short-subunit alcohol dehydrogenase family)